jgi:hypothetical protein
MHFPKLPVFCARTLLSLPPVSLVASVVIEGCGVSLQVLEVLRLYSQYIAASYCANNYNSTADSVITCPTDSCPEVQALKPTAFGSFSNVGKVSASALLAADHACKKLFLAFSGAETLAAAETQFDNALLKYTARCPHCGCHTGSTTWTSVRDRVVTLLSGAKSLFPNIPW